VFGAFGSAVAANGYLVLSSPNRLLEAEKVYLLDRSQLPHKITDTSAYLYDEKNLFFCVNGKLTRQS
jgi:hypothetical protein